MRTPCACTSDWECRSSSDSDRPRPLSSICSMMRNMPTSVCRATEITVDLPPEQAMALFTPEGERRWADGWDPHFPEPRRREGPGAVFTTEHGGHQTTWIMVDQGPEGVRYARVTEATSAGTVAVDVAGTRNGGTQVRVTYDLTATSAAGEAWLEAFDAHYEAAIAEWATEIAAALERPAGQDS